MAVVDVPVPMHCEVHLDQRRTMTYIYKPEIKESP